MKNISRSGIVFWASIIICICGVVLSCIKNANNFNFSSCGITLVIVFGLLAFISVFFYLLGVGD